MALGAILRRDLLVSTRRKAFFTERFTGLILLAVILYGWAAVSDWAGWDRHSVAGTTSFSLATFALYIATQLLLSLGLVSNLVAPAIASERDRRTLDALLSTRLSAAEVVLGAMGSALLRYANCLLPIVPLLAFFRAVDTRLILLAFAGVTSTACCLAAVAVAISTGARTAARATRTTVLLANGWLWVPMLSLMILPRIWPAAARGLAPLAFPMLDSSPLAVGLSLAGVLPRGTPVDCVLRMIAYQSAASVVLILWAIVRLRAASRAVHDLEGRTALRRMLSARSRPRPACGDDPVLWRERHSRRSSRALLLLGYALNAIWIGLVACVVTRYAVPAFIDLFQHGYGVGTPSIARTLADAGRSGQARLDFNLILRLATGVIDFIYILLVAGVAAENIVIERERDTWSGLIATPLTGREILRAKMFGSVLRTRVIGFLLLALWTVGLLAGAVHPLGFLAAILGLAVSSWFLAALGIYSSLCSPNRNQATTRALGPLLLTMGLCLLPTAMPGTSSVLLAGITLPFPMWVSLLSYDDVHAVLHSGFSPQLASIGLNGTSGGMIVLAVWAINLVAQGVGAHLLSRAAFRGFDRAVGRPVRP
jgi:ABC-type transport system involved in multi-copper enzyme maturation permease subunit